MSKQSKRSAVAKNSNAATDEARTPPEKTEDEMENKNQSTIEVED